ncbi:thiamine pyrophosphate-requiring protein (plasmid) [Diaphorobacter sp. HDW4B]|uniref:thiamine pyrophosphate-requiring protein n=1 Tax=Diaphorobacter sp. HDW4B TaxID=2714925 RepID=UPI001408AA8B|nr:thiamine pyrophosphate-requiring protein [Diaphorobacter sp. HDW4B]QIL73966.1 thiamine pyrophosphate-requiring protein [Diaphorobacter sp. HDW4B]
MNMPRELPSGSTTEPLATATPTSVAEAYLSLLKTRGIDYFYIGAGTDTAPIVEAYAKGLSGGQDFPEPVIAVHENLAVGMAHGYYMVTGKPQAVMLHVTVGAANAVCGLMNAARSQVPMFFTAGRTPLYEKGVLGARNSPIHWAQEMFDQAGMARELVKWDYELRDGRNVDEVVDRGLSIAMAEPRGPIYLTLPREVLAQPMPADYKRRPAQPVVSAPYPDPEGVTRIAQAIKNAKYPLIVVSSSGADTQTVPVLDTLLRTYGIAVAESMGHFVNVPFTHPHHLGHDATAVVSRADVVLTIESDVPWVPGRAEPPADAFIAQVGVDPLFQDLPLRSFQSSVTLVSRSLPFLKALQAELERIGAADTAADRIAKISADSLTWRTSLTKQLEQDTVKGGLITKQFLSHCIDQVRPKDALVISEYTIRAEHMSFTEPGTYFLNSTAGGLGWGFPAALGAQQAAPDKLVICVQGDGAYMFTNPASCHQAAEMHNLPVLMIVFNNHHWQAVEQTTLAVYPDGATRAYVKEHGMAPLSGLGHMPDFEMYAQASGGYGEKVNTREELLPALQRAIHAVTVEKRHALLNVMGA